jgi:hypothetical protein
MGIVLPVGSSADFLLHPQNHKTLEPAQLLGMFTKQTDAAKN